MKILLAGPHGFCAGVVMATRCLETALEMLGPPLYVYHEIVHNRYVVDRFRQRGVVFVEDVREVPENSNLLFSAHGVSPAVRQQAQQRNLRIIDATCPLVAKVHHEARRFAELEYSIVLIGHADHDEIQGVMGEAPQQMLLVESEEDVQRIQPADPQRVAYLTQTTLSVDDAARIITALRQRFPAVVGPPKEDICFATQNRQEAVRRLAREADRVLVLGSENSSNANRLVEVALQCGVPAQRIDSVQELQSADFSSLETLLLTAGASTPAEVVEECLDWFRQHFQAEVEDRVIQQENVHFSLPKALSVLPSPLVPLQPAVSVL